MMANHRALAEALQPSQEVNVFHQWYVGKAAQSLED
jgi:hypothetical protein